MSTDLIFTMLGERVGADGRSAPLLGKNRPSAALPNRNSFPSRFLLAVRNTCRACDNSPRKIEYKSGGRRPARNNGSHLAVPERPRLAHGMNLSSGKQRKGAPKCAPPMPLAPERSLRLCSARTRSFPLFDLVLPPRDSTSTEHQPLRE